MSDLLPFSRRRDARAHARWPDAAAAPDQPNVWQSLNDWAGRITLQVLRLAVLALVVFVGVAIVRHGTRALQEMAGKVAPTTPQITR